MRRLFQRLDASAEIDMEYCPIHDEGRYRLDTGRLSFFQARFFVAKMDNLKSGLYRFCKPSPLAFHVLAQLTIYKSIISAPNQPTPAGGLRQAAGETEMPHTFHIDDEDLQQS